MPVEQTERGRLTSIARRPQCASETPAEEQVDIPSKTVPTRDAPGIAREDPALSRVPRTRSKPSAGGRRKSPTR